MLELCGDYLKKLIQKRSVAYRGEEIVAGGAARLAVSSSEALGGKTGVVFAMVALLSVESVVVLEGV